MSFLGKGCFGYQAKTQTLAYTARVPDLNLSMIFWGGDKTAYIAALRQAQFYPPRQAAAAAARALRQLQI